MTEAVLGLIEAMRNMEPPWNYNSKEKTNNKQTETTMIILEGWPQG